MAAGCAVSLSSPGGVQVLVSILIFAASCDTSLVSVTTRTTTASVKGVPLLLNVSSTLPPSPNISDASSSPPTSETTSTSNTALNTTLNTALNTALNTTRQTTSNTTVPSGVEVLEEDGGGLLGAGLVALLSMLSVVAVLLVLVALSRTLGFLTPPFERLDDVPLESPNEESPFAHKY